jgi:hypothetical protein
MRFHRFHLVSTRTSTVVTTPGVYGPGRLENKEKTTTMPDNHILQTLEQRYASGYARRRSEGEITLALLGGQPRHYGNVMLLTRTAGHPDPDNAAPAVVLARNDYGIAVVELFDPPDTSRVVVDLDAERDRRRARIGEEA